MDHTSTMDIDQASTTVGHLKRALSMEDIPSAEQSARKRYKRHMTRYCSIENFFSEEAQVVQSETTILPMVNSSTGSMEFSVVTAMHGLTLDETAQNDVGCSQKVVKQKLEKFGNECECMAEDVKIELSDDKIGELCHSVKPINIQALQSLLPSTSPVFSASPNWLRSISSTEANLSPFKRYRSSPLTNSDDSNSSMLPELGSLYNLDWELSSDTRSHFTMENAVIEWIDNSSNIPWMLYTYDKPFSSEPNTPPPVVEIVETLQKPLIQLLDSKGNNNQIDWNKYLKAMGICTASPLHTSFCCKFQKNRKAMIALHLLSSDVNNLAPVKYCFVHCLAIIPIKVIKKYLALQLWNNTEFHTEIDIYLPHNDNSLRDHFSLQFVSNILWPKKHGAIVEMDEDLLQAELLEQIELQVENNQNEPMIRQHFMTFYYVRKSYST